MLTRHGRSFEVKHLQKNRFTHPLSLSILHLEPFPRRDSNHHRNKISSLKPTGGERESALLCSQGDPPDLWQPPGDGVSLRLNPGRGGGGTGSDSKDNSWDLVNQGKILSVKGASLDGLALKLKFSERKWSVTVGKDSENHQQSYM
ncbi:BnaC08g48730D [Brassica napus]|uniref:BnaC08g48730D protein n=1 Tax=Brassica napus TaxID=3708 RepID=A0A078J5T5_BRANA|nr:BnaC08g48730D [Brassica napus]